MPSTIVLAYAYRSDYLARCIDRLADARSSIKTLARFLFSIPDDYDSVSRQRGRFDGVPAVIGRHEIPIIEDAGSRDAEPRFYSSRNAACRAFSDETESSTEDAARERRVARPREEGFFHPAMRSIPSRS